MYKVAKLIALVVVLLFGTGCGQSKQELVSRGNRFLESGQLADAELKFRKAIQSDANYGDAYYGLALVKLQQEKLSDAYELLSRAVDLMPGSDKAKIKLADVSLAAYMAESRYRK